MYIGRPSSPPTSLSLKSTIPHAPSTVTTVSSRPPLFVQGTPPSFVTAPFVSSLDSKGKVQAAQDAAGPQNHLALADGRLGKATAHVKRQVPQAIDEVEGKGEAEEELDAALDRERQRSESRGNASALEMETKEWRNQVRGEVGVGDARQRAAGDTGPGGVTKPRLLDLVDAQMGGHGSLQTLLGEDVVAVFGGELRGRDGATSTLAFSFLRTYSVLSTSRVKCRSPCLHPLHVPPISQGS